MSMMQHDHHETFRCCRLISWSGRLCSSAECDRATALASGAVSGGYNGGQGRRGAEHLDDRHDELAAHGSAVLQQVRLHVLHDQVQPGPLPQHIP